MRDSFGRTIDYLRAALTDRCNLRCWYCVGRGDEKSQCVDYTSDEHKLTNDEFQRVLRLAVERLGIVKIRLTGGEPLLYPKLEELVGTLRGLPSLRELTLTTNGLLLQEKAESLYRTGLDRINVSLEGATEEAYREITGRACLQQVLAGLEALLEVGFAKPKINIVLCRQFDREELKRLLEIGQSYGSELRFIELMGHPEVSCPTLDDMLKSFRELGSIRKLRGRGTATHRYRLEGYGVDVGLIPSRTHPFCSTCSRIRLASDGQLRTCLYTRQGVELRSYLRNGCSDEILVKIMREAIHQKPNQAAGNEVRMCQIGG
jgi:cyclic pyranopterin phosphate synthase